MSVNPRKSNASGFPSPLLTLLTSANRPNSGRRVFVWVQFQPELLQPFPKFPQEPIRVSPVHFSSTTSLSKRDQTL
jgi:hypothetical protein